MKFRKIICFVMAFALAVGALERGSVSRDGLSVCAADEETEKPGKEELPGVIADIRRRVNIPAGANDYEWDSELWRENIPSYSITWKNPKNPGSLTVYYWNGFIYGYDDPNIYPIKPTLVNSSPEEQEELARAWIYKLNPGLDGDIVLERRDNYYSLDGDVAFDIKRLEQGLDVAGNCGTITVNRDSGELRSLKLTEWWAGAKFADSKKALTREEIYDIYTSRFSQTAEYELYSNYTFDSEKNMSIYDFSVLPLYKSSTGENAGENVLDAFSGEYSSYYKDIKEMSYSMPYDWDETFNMCGGGRYDGDVLEDITETEIEAFKASKKGQEPISSEDILKLINEDEFIKLDSCLSLVKDETEYTTDEKYELRLLRRLKFEYKAKHNRADSIYLTVSLDAYTGRITEFSKAYVYGENSKTKNTTPLP